MRTVTALQMTETDGFFVDREDIDSAAVVGPIGGDVFLSEPFEEEGVVHRGCIPGRAVERFELREADDGALLVLRFRRGERVLEHEIGWVAPELPVREWVERVNALYAPAVAAPSP